MKKRLEAELISIAHRILKLKNKSEVDQLYKETQKLYETLSVLKFYQDNFESVKSEVSAEVLEEKLESNAVEPAAAPVVETKEEVVEAVDKPEVEVAQPEEEANQPETEEESTDELDEEQAAEVTDEQNVVSEESEETVEEELEEEPTVEEEPAHEEETEEEVVAEDTRAQGELSEAKPSFEPIFELEAEEEKAPEETKSEEKLEDHIGKYADPVFVKPDEVTLFPTEAPAETREEIRIAIPAEAPKSALSEGHTKTIAIGLNDRIGFVQHLFNDSSEDFNRVISQLNTFDTFEEAKTFINEMVIPDYNYWVGEEDYIERFMAIVEKKFE